MYTPCATPSLANDAVLGCFTVLKGDEEVASTGNVVMPTATPDNTKGRRYLWFCDISVDGGLAVYSDPNADYTAVDAAIAKGRGAQGRGLRGLLRRYGGYQSRRPRQGRLRAGGR